MRSRSLGRTESNTMLADFCMGSYPAWRQHQNIQNISLSKLYQTRLRHCLLCRHSQRHKTEAEIERTGPSFHWKHICSLPLLSKLQFCFCFRLDYLLIQTNRRWPTPDNKTTCKNHHYKRYPKSFLSWRRKYLSRHLISCSYPSSHFFLSSASTFYSLLSSRNRAAHTRVFSFRYLPPVVPIVGNEVKFGVWFLHERYVLKCVTSCCFSAIFTAFNAKITSLAPTYRTSLSSLNSKVE